MGDDGKPKRLGRQQINQCFMEIEDVHPLRRKHITDVIPPLRCFQKCGCLKKKKSLRETLREIIVEELRENYEPAKGEIPFIPENERESDANPFLRVGYGVNSFFDIMKRLIYMLIGITIVIFPVMVIYKHNPEKGIVGLEKPSYKTMFNTMTLGNMGGAQTHCLSKRLLIDKEEEDQSIVLNLQCPNGKRAKIVQNADHIGDHDGKFQHPFKAGIMAEGLETRDFCSNDLIWKEKTPSGAPKYTKRSKEHPKGVPDC
jgi:hypothetical protein